MNKESQRTLLIVDFSKAFECMHREKMEKVLLAYGFLKEIIIAIMMHYKNMNVKFCSSDSDVDFFDIIAEVLQRDTLAPYLFIFCQDYVLWISVNIIKENGFTL